MRHSLDLLYILYKRKETLLHLGADSNNTFKKVKTLTYIKDSPSERAYSQFSRGSLFTNELQAKL